MIDNPEPPQWRSSQKCPGIVLYNYHNCDLILEQDGSMILFEELSPTNQTKVPLKISTKDI